MIQIWYMATADFKLGKPSNWDSTITKQQQHCRDWGMLSGTQTLALSHPMCAHGEVSSRECDKHTPACCMGSMARSYTCNPIRAEEVIRFAAHGGMTPKPLWRETKEAAERRKQQLERVRRSWGAEPQICKWTQWFFVLLFSLVEGKVEWEG